ncbi:YpoC family protein [Mammaliicoccus vitulinus]|uniref:YpoC family protein n=1 Tax=Mammaliicoccus vitulinus TaxID=71237 RepID=UPI003F9BECCA
MIEKQDFIELEEQIEPLVINKKLKSDYAHQLLDQYYALIIGYIEQINQIDKFDISEVSNYPVIPMNFEERYQYINDRIYHFMGYRQMVTLKDELIKMNARYQLKLKREAKLKQGD